MSEENPYRTPVPVEELLVAERVPRKSTLAGRLLAGLHWFAGGALIVGSVTFGGLTYEDEPLASLAPLCAGLFASCAAYFWREERIRTALTFDLLILISLVAATFV